MANAGPRGLIKAGKGTLIGDAGEHFVLAELLRRGIVAALAPRNMPGYDLFAVQGTASVKIRVKTKTAAAKTFVWVAREGGTVFADVTMNDLTVLVDLQSVGDAPIYYAVQTKELSDRLQQRYLDWLEAKPSKGPRHRENRMRRLDFDGWQQWLLDREGEKAWSLIETMLAQATEPQREQS